MKYPESHEILNKIKSAQNIIVSCHRNPDPDSLGSALSLKLVLENMEKRVKIISPSEIASPFKFLDVNDEVEIVEKIDEYEISSYDLFIFADISSKSRVFSSEDYSIPIDSINIDNHISNTKFAALNLVDVDTSSVSEMLYFIYKDWGVNFNSKLANYLMAGILGDTGGFQFEVYESTFSVADDLFKNGADLKKINLHLFMTYEEEIVRFWGLVIDNLVIDQKNKFAYACLNHEQYKEYVHVLGTRETAASKIIRNIEGTDFGFVMTEEQPSQISISLRSRTNFDVSQIAIELGGGGHPGAAGVHINNFGFEEAKNKILETARKYANK